MAERTQPFNLKFWASMSRFERIALVGTVLIWFGVILFGAGLYMAWSTTRERQAAYAQATAMALSATEPVLPMPTSVAYPAGWSTATPTVEPPETVVDPGSEKVEDRIDLEAGPAMLMLTPLPTVSAQAEHQSTSTPRSIVSPRATAASTPTPRPLGPPDRIVIPSIDLDTSVVPVGWHFVAQGNAQYSVWDVADYAAGWHKTSAFLGEAGNTVISGHNNIRGEVFRDLIDVEVGGYVFAYVGEAGYSYQVTEKHLLKEQGEPIEVRRENATWIAPQPDERLTLVTCWPYTGNSHRLVVVARPAPPPDAGQIKE
ncbi:MAG: sortase [Anaerolineae bacterium]|nr:sortase [Anaerolineae bacterium]